MTGKVYLVGAGPGDYKLITLKGIECIKKADVIIYDRLVSTKLLDYRKDNCRLIYVGKESSNHTKTQDQINEILWQEASKEQIVTRLKGGDPYVFGRGGEEGQYLVERNIDVEVIPGITSAIGGLAYAGIPITHRECASSFHVITGHLKDENEELNWDVLGRLKGTLVFLMGMAEIEKITSNLREKGMDSNTPVAVINWATTDKQKVVTGTLKDIYETTIREKIKSPSIIVVGEVVKLRKYLNFIENRSLHGKNILVTRARQQSSKLSEKIYDLGGNPVEFPVIKIEDLSNESTICEEIKKVNEYNYVIFTSQNGVKIFFERMYNLGLDNRQLSDAKIVAIGNTTAEEIKKYHINPDIVPSNYVAESIYKEVAPLLSVSDKILIPRAKEARNYLVDELEKICTVKELKIYQTVLGQGIEKKEEIKELILNNKIDYITFTSSSTVKNLINMLDNHTDILNKTKLISIGPITSKTIIDHGLKVHKEAEKYDIDGIIKVLVDDKKEN